MCLGGRVHDTLRIISTAGGVRMRGAEGCSSPVGERDSSVVASVQVALAEPSGVSSPAVLGFCSRRPFNIRGAAAT